MSDIVERLNDSLPGITTAVMGGDNLAIVLCSFFDDGDKETQDENGWSQAARDGYEEVIAAIRSHYEPIADIITSLRAEVERLKEELDIWKSVFPDIAPERVLPDRSKLEAENERLRAAAEAICMMDISWVGDAFKLKDTARAALEDRHD